MVQWIVQNHEERIDKVEAMLAAERERHAAELREMRKVHYDYVREQSEKEKRQLRWGLGLLLAILGTIATTAWDVGWGLLKHRLGP